MTITQTLMEIGTWSIDLVDQTPGPIIDLLDDWYSLLVVTAQRLPLRTVADLDRPLFRGIYLSRTDPRTLTGAGPEWNLGSPGDDISQQDGFGPYFSELWSTASVTSALGHITGKNGLTGAAVGSISATTTGGISGSPRIALDQVICAQTGTEWRVRPELLIEVYKPSDAVATPKALISPDPGGREPGRITWRLAGVEPQVGVDDLRNREVVRYNSGASSVTTGAPSDARKAYGGGQLEVSGYDSVDSTVSADATARATDLLGKQNRVTRSLVVHVADYAPHAQLLDPDLLVGGSVEIFAPDYGLYDRSVRPVPFRGRQIFPTTRRVTQVEWQVTAGMGVYLDNRHQGGALVDVTDYVSWEATGADDADTIVTLDAAPRLLSGARRPLAA